MSAIPPQQETIRQLLTQKQLSQAQSRWLDLAEDPKTKPELLLVLIKEFADAGEGRAAAELASLLAPTLKTTGKPHEWLYALKLQAQANVTDKALRTELLEAYQTIYAADPRLKTILAAAELDQPKALLPEAIAKTDTLLALGSGSYCRHKSWGFGRIKSFDAALNRLLVSFPHNPEHAFQLPYAATSLTPISSDHLEVRKATDLAGLQQLAANEPLALLRIALVSYSHRLTAEQLETALSPSVIPGANWKSWWDATKRLAKKDPHFEIPARKTEPVLLRTVPVSQQAQLLEAFNEAVGFDQKLTAARQLLKSVDEIADPELLLQELQDGLLGAYRALRPNKHAERLEAVFLVQEIRRHQKTPAESIDGLLAEALGKITDLPAVLEQLGSADQKRAIAALKQHQPALLAANLQKLDTKLLEEIPEVLAATATAIAQSVQNHNAGIEMLLWLCRAYTSPKAPAWLEQVSGPMLLSAVINAIESAEYRSTTKRLRDQLFNDEALIVELLATAPPDVIRAQARALLVTSAFEELDRRSLMARLVKEFPFVQDLLVSRTAKEQPLIVSWVSLRRRQAELEDLVQKKIPQNSREISEARSYGDLRENFEYKAAKDMQKVLMRRRAELEVLLARAQGTDFADAKTDLVNIGTTVVATDLGANKTLTFHVLGAWDSDPARGIISYPAGLAQALMNKGVGQTVEFAGEHGPQKLRIDRIGKVAPEVLQHL